jgi:hypothetical protein
MYLTRRSFGTCPAAVVKLIEASTTIDPVERNAEK